MSQATDYELAFWGDCLNTFEEERKHHVYAGLMGLTGFTAHNARVLDIGGGPVSMLLKCADRGVGCMVADPLMFDFPGWVRARYAAADIRISDTAGERIDEAREYGEVWIYNVLQHVDDPQLVIKNARAAAPVIRLFEWINIPAYDGHPHELTATALEHWLGWPGVVTQLAVEGCYGTAFSGVFG